MVDNKYSSVMLLVLSVFFIFSLTIVSALPLASVDQTNTPSLIERINSNNLFNLTINSTSENITRVDIYVTGLGGDIGNLVESFVVGTNRTDAGNVVIFRNSTVGGVTSLSWENATANGGLIPNNTNYTFTFNLTGRSLTMQGLSNITINITGISGNKAQISSFVKGYSFSFSGNVKNTTTDCQNNTNVSLYLFAMGTNGPPTETYVKSVLTSGSDGCLFSMTGINTTGSSQMYKLKLIKYANLSNSSFNCASLSSNCVATSVGPTMQDFPTMMYYSMPTPPGMLEWMMPPTLNGTTFTLQSAVTINVSTYSNTTTSMHNFGYELMDINSGFPITSAMNDNQTSYQIVVPAGRDYNLMVARQPNKFSMATNECNGIHYNSTHCPAPPKTNASLGTLTATQGSVIQARLNITVEKRYLYGCLGISGNTSAVANISAIVAKMIPYTGFVPPVKGDDGSLNISNPLQVNTSFTNCSGGGMFAFYNISLMNTNYMIAFYATNKSNISTSGETYAQFYNVSLTDSQTITNGNYTNLTLKLLLGTWTNEDSDGVNVTKMKINILNASGNIYSSFTGHIEVVTKRPTNGKVRYMIESRNATFFIPIISDTTLATVNVFSNGPPVEKKLNLSLNENNITVSDGQGFGFKKKLTNGSFEDMNVSATPIRMRLITNSVACNIINYADSCVISNMSAESFNPFKAMTAGKVNLEMKMTNTNTTITFMNFDMFAAKPPTNSMFDESGTTSGSTNQVWKFGSFAPKDAYDYVIVAMPYSASVINESADVRMKIPALYDEDNNLAWNSSNGGTTANLPVEYIEKTANYNSTGYSDFLGSTGLNCSKTDSNISNFYCFINTSTNMIYMKVPHFSTIEPNIVGTASATSTTTTTTSGGGGLAEVSFWSSTIVMTNEQFTNGYTKEMPVKARFRFTVNSEQHTAGIISLTTTTATINISSTPQQATLSIGDTRKFDVNDDKFYDVIITLNSIASAKASLTIKSIHEAVTTTTQAQETLKEAAATGGQETGTEITESTPKKDYTLIGILITLLIIVVAVVLLIRKIRNDKWISLKTQKKKKVYIKL